MAPHAETGGLACLAVFGFVALSAIDFGAFSGAAFATFVFSSGGFSALAGLGSTSVRGIDSLPSA